ncbi:MAG: class I SAM-dependent methyltransferase [Oscillospiraceae bacterium]|nr:class I SAM-dependent methyltransferase [Oscillospiraceae bacterium]
MSSFGYSRFAKHYDLLTGNVDYDEIADMYDRLITQYGRLGGTLLDLGCGTGSLSERMCKKGYDVIGLDASGDMLSVADMKKNESGLDIQYVCQDMTALELYGRVDYTVSSLDCLNHLQGEKELRRTFARVSEYTEDGGLFIFDMNTLRKHREVLSDNCFIYEEEDVFCVWQNFFDEETGCVEISLDFFEMDEEGRYDRYCEDFAEMAYPIESVGKWLGEAGFELLCVKDGFSMNEGSEESERVVFCARKVKDKE